MQKFSNNTLYFVFNIAKAHRPLTRETVALPKNFFFAKKHSNTMALKQNFLEQQNKKNMCAEMPLNLFCIIFFFNIFVLFY